MPEGYDSSVIWLFRYVSVELAMAIIILIVIIVDIYIEQGKQNEVINNIDVLCQ